MSIKNYKMRTKILLLSTTLFLIFTVFVSAYIIPTTTKSIEAQNKTRLINLVDICYSTAEKYHTAFLNGEIEESVAKEKAIAEIRSFRYGNGDYFFINGYNNISIMHPLNLALEGQDLTGLEDPNGVMIFQEMNKVVTKEGSGFVNYVWDKPGSNTPQPKLTYVKGFDDWGWIIGTGVYIDDLTAIKMTLIRNVVISLGLIILASIIISIKMSRSISKPLVELKNIAEKISKGDINIDIDTSTKDEVGDLSRSFENVISSIKNVISETNILEEKISKGYLDSQADSSKFTGGWNSIISGTNNVSRILEKHLRSVPAIIMAIDTDYNVLYLNEAGLSFMDTKSKEEIMKSKCYDLFCTNDCRTSDCACSMSFADGSSHNRETTARPDGKEFEITYNAVPIKDKNGKIHGAFELIIDQTEIKKAEKYQAEQLIIQEEAAKVKDKQALYQNNEVKKLLTSINKLAQGNLNLTISASKHDEDTKEISELFSGIYSSLHEMTTSIKSYIDEISIILAKLSNKDFDVEIRREYKGDFTTMKKSINELVESFNSKLWEINEASKQVLMGTNQVSQSSQSLSQGATEQASSIEQISTTMSSVLDQTKSNAQNAIKANELSNQIHTYAESGSNQMGQMLRSMDDINEASNNISRIIKVIDDIAFQTNILALNAAVEAARAGQYGKGFAVVAEEVRNLAERSKNAARETTEMIESTIQKVQIGTEIANDTSAALEKIVTSVKESEVLANEIATLSGSQTEAITQVNSGIVEISTVIQQNVALAEESAATSQEMASQAHMLNQITEEYNLKDVHGHREDTAIYEEIRTSMID